MSIQERPRLTYQIRKQVADNRANGDQRSWDGSEWRKYESPIKSYDDTFRLALGRRIASFAGGKKSPVVVDLMATSYALRSLFEQTPKPRLGLAVSLEDLRDNEEKKRDEELNVHQLAGDIMSSFTWRTIGEVMQGRKADLIMERALGGLNILPPPPQTICNLDK